MTSGYGIAFISNILDMRISMPQQLTSTIVLDRCSPAERRAVQTFFMQNGIAANRRSFYETERVPFPEGTTEPKPLPLDLDSWRYYALRYSGDHEQMTPMLKLTYISTASLESDIILHFGTANGEESVTAAVGFNFNWRGHLMPPAKITFDQSHCDDLRECIATYEALDQSKYSNIKRAVELFYEAKHLPENKHFLALQWFAVLEMLLTHQPGNKEVGDSIRHQLNTKIPLMYARMPEPRTISEYDHLPSEKLWDALYGYRSAVAHGNEIDFLGARLRSLKSASCARRFLREATRQILRQAIREPQLVTYLKAV
jgi:hypothetical protein